MLSFLCVFASLLLFPSLALSELNPYRVETQGQNPDYICKIDYVCLNDLHNILLNKESNRSIYQFCEITHQNIKNCCINPYGCPEGYAKNITQDLRKNSLNWVQQTNTDLVSCHLGNISKLISALSGTQNETCNVGVQNCQIKCKNKLEEFKEFFEKCFSIQYPYSIDYVLEKAKNPVRHQSCYKEIRKVAEKYKRQSRNKQSLFKENLQAKDIVDCPDIKQSASRQNLNNLALNVCQQAQSQKQEQKEEERGAKQDQIVEQKQQVSGLSSTMESKDIAKPVSGSSADSSSLGARTLTGAGAGHESKAVSGSIRPQKIDSKFKNSSQSGSLPSSAFLPDSPSPVKTRVKKESFQNKAHTIFSLSLTHEQNLDSYSNLPPNKSKGFFGKTLDKGKSFGRRIVQAIKIKFSDLKGKSKKGLASFMAVKADDIFCNPAIAHQMVYQSVESPQIEPLDKQEFQINPDKPVFKSYDLVRRKSAGVVVEIKYPRSCTLDDEKFTLGLDIDAESVEKIKCLSFIQNTQRDLEFSSSFPSESDCIFSIKDFSTTDEILKFIEFPMDSINKDRRDMPVRVNLFDENGHSISNSGYVSVDNNNWEKLSYCAEFINLSSANEFCLNMYSAKSLSLGVISIKGGCNNKDLSSAPYAINNLISSDEVQDYLPVIFPMILPQYFGHFCS